SQAYGLMMARKEGIPPETLNTFLKKNNTTFAAAADQFVESIVFHEVGHFLTAEFGIDPQNRWLDELLASYWSYAYISERQPQRKEVCDLLGRPSKIRPQNTSLEELERLYMKVDDYGWYQGMFEERIREIYPALGLKFLRDLRRDFPKTGDSKAFDIPLGRRLKPAEVLARSERIAPGFLQWAAGLSSSALPVK